MERPRAAGEGPLFAVLLDSCWHNSHGAMEPRCVEGIRCRSKGSPTALGQRKGAMIGNERKRGGRLQDLACIFGEGG